jgi:predicted enzyme related to lactoylglutathione lyase
MSESKVSTAAVPVWVDVAEKDAKQAQDFYKQLFNWDLQELGPEAGNYGFFLKDGKMTAGVGPLMSEQQPTAWSIYIGTDDADATAEKVKQNGGTVIAEPMDVMDVGRMAVFMDPTGAFISVWQRKTGGTMEVQSEPNSFGWAELTARGIEKAKPFYTAVFGWGVRDNPMEQGMVYTEWMLGEKSIAGGWEMPPSAPAEAPSAWIPYFTVADLDASHKKARDLGADESMPPTPYPGGRFSVLRDPQGAGFGLISTS